MNFRSETCTLSLLNNGAKFDYPGGLIAFVTCAQTKMSYPMQRHYKATVHSLNAKREGKPKSRGGANSCAFPSAQQIFGLPPLGYAGNFILHVNQFKPL